MECSPELFDTIDTLFLLLSPKGEVQFINRVCRETTGYSREEAEGQLFWRLFFQPSEWNFIQNLFQEAQRTPYRTSYENPWHCQDGGKRLISFTISAYQGDMPTPICCTVTGLDITKLRRMEEELWQYRTNLEEQIRQRNAELLASQERLFGIVDSAEDAIISINSQQQITLFNNGAEKIFGYRAHEVLGKNLGVLIPSRFVQPHRQMVKDFGSTEAVSRRMSERGEIIGKRKDGQEFSAEANISQMTIQNEKIYTAVLRDISERKVIEQELRDSLNEKEILLREIHHRVKNNLQIISSLFTMQSHTTDDPERQMLIRESQHRIQSMALIHEKMYQSENLAQVRFDHYIRELVTDIFQSYEVFPGKIRLFFEMEPVSLEVNTAIPCALILNELTSNTLKYAFPGKNTGSLSIQMKQTESGNMQLDFRDDGQGLPQHLELKNVQTLGLRLVRVLTRQLKGTLELDRRSGTAFYFQIPLS